MQVHTTWIEHALEVAKQALPQDVPVGAVLVKDGQVIAEACNRREHDNDPTGHAEILALAMAGKSLGNWRMNDVTLYVTLEPCLMCAEAIRQARVSIVVFGAYDPLFGACGSKHNVFSDERNIKILGGINEDACTGLLNEFFASKRA